MNEYVECLDVFGKKHKVLVSKLKWRPSVYGIVIRDNAVLLSRQFGDKFDLPGGGVEIDESLNEGVIREVKEETGINVDNPILVAVEDNYFQSSHADNISYHSVLLYYTCNHIGGELSVEGFDEDEKKYAEIAEWVPISKLNDIDIASTIDFRPIIHKAV